MKNRLSFQIVRWYVKVGDPVKRDQPLAYISSDAVDTELYCHIDGRVSRLMFENTPFEGVIVIKPDVRG